MRSNEVDRELQLGQVVPRYPNADYLRICMSLKYGKTQSASRRRNFVNIIMNSIMHAGLTIDTEVAEKTASLADNGYKLFCLIQILYAHIMWRQNQGILGMDQTIKHHAWLDMLTIGKLPRGVDSVFAHPAHVTLCHDLGGISFLYHDDFIESSIAYHRLFGSDSNNISNPIIARKPYINNEDMAGLCLEYQAGIKHLLSGSIIFARTIRSDIISSICLAAHSVGKQVTTWDLHMGEVRVMDGHYDYLDTSKLSVEASTEPVSKKMRELSRKIPKLAELRTKAAAKSRKLPSVPGHDPQKPWKSNRTKR